MRKALFVALLIIMMPYCIGCDTYQTFNQYPHQKSTEWYCDEIDFTFYYAKNLHDNLAPVESQLEWAGETFYVYVYFHAGQFYICSNTEDQDLENDVELLRGTWCYQGEKLILEITGGSLFDGAYKNLTFMPQK